MKMFTALTIYKLYEILKDKNPLDNLLNKKMHEIFASDSQEINFLEEINVFMQKQIKEKIDFKNVTISQTSGTIEVDNKTYTYYDKTQLIYLNNGPGWYKNSPTQSGDNPDTLPSLMYVQNKEYFSNQ